MATTGMAVTGEEQARPDDGRHRMVGAGAGTSVTFLGELITFKLRGAETAGAYAVHEQVTPAGGGVPFLHTHATQETFYVLEGEFEFYGLYERGKYAMRATAGTTVHLRARAPHGYRNVGQTPGRMLVVFQPAGNMELLLAEGGIPVADPTAPPAAPAPPDPALLGRLIEKYDIEGAGMVLGEPAGPSDRRPARAGSLLLLRRRPRHHGDGVAGAGTVHDGCHPA